MVPRVFGSLVVRSGVDCILNIAISEKKAQGCIRMNIDARPYNKGAKDTRYHVTTPQEARHKLKGAKIFSEFDMGNGFHQVPLHTDSHVVFQSHLGLHKMKRLFFGPTNSSGIFHHEVTKVFTGLEGCITIHDNLLVYGADEKEHNKNMAAMLERAKKKGVTLKLSKSTICEPEVKWFGRIFSGQGCQQTRIRSSTSSKQASPRRSRTSAPCCRQRPTTPSTASTTRRTSHTRR